VTRGLTRRQIGVTDAMLATYAETVFRLSNNVQRRVGDPVRLLDFDAVEAQRNDLGMSDRQIADRIGLTEAQVTYIRNIAEARRHDGVNFHRLLDLGGGRRYRKERFVPHQERPVPSAAAQRLREALHFPPVHVDQFVKKGWWRNDTLSLWLKQRLAETPDAAAVADQDGAIKYRDLSEQADRLAGGLTSAGVGRGDVVAMQIPNLKAFFVIYLGVTRIGAVLQTIHMPYRGSEIETLLSHSQARAVICVADAGGYKLAATMLEMREKLPNLEAVIAIGEVPPGAISFADIVAGEASADAMEIDPPVGADPFLLLYTSGTTSMPKGVPHNYHTLLSNARLCVPAQQFTSEDRILSASPYSHLLGLSSVHHSLLTGACSVALPMATPDALAATVEQMKATVLYAAPAHMQAMLNMGLLDERDFSSLRLLVVSGAPVSADLAHAVAGKIPQASFTTLWGMTEVQAGLFSLPGDDLEQTAGTTGRPSPGTSIRLIADNGGEAAVDEEGELQMFGPSVFAGYLENPEANAQCFTDDGWFRSGDLAIKDKNGNITISGRIKDIINRGGIKYNPLDVEALIDKHPLVAQSAIVPMSDPVLGEKACCFVVLTGDGELSLDELCGYLLNHNIAKIKLPERLEIIDEMPLTPTRKVIKGRLEISDN
jgi:non-ribosomal peptide synthetase component E (peptide arylation enzyme)